jgi:enamine deaminase RidA (YjgF/YER057c/UK114 family)
MDNSLKRESVSTKTPWEPILGYCRAVRLGPYVYVSGTTAIDEYGKVIAEGDPYGQTVFIIRKIERALKEVGAKLSDVARTRIFITDINDWRKVAVAHFELFGNIRPASTLVEVSRLIDQKLLVEIEADAIISQ